MLIGEKVFLRPPIPEDLGLIHDWLNSPGVMGPVLGVKLRSIRDLEKQFEDDGFLAPDRGTLIIGSDAGDNLGFCHWWAPTPGEEVREVALFIGDHKVRKQGLGTAAFQLLIHYLFSSYPVERIQAIFPSSLTTARAMAERAGMVEEGTLRHSTFLAGKWEDQVMVAIIRGEWEDHESFADLRKLFANPPESHQFKPVGFNG